MSTTAPETIKIKCNCACHHDQHTKHAEPCCNNGWIDVPAEYTTKTIEGPRGPVGNLDEIVNKYLQENGYNGLRRHKFHYHQLREFLLNFAKQHIK